MQFNRFNSLTTLSPKYIDFYREHAGDARFYVSEKIDGANFQVTTDGTDVQFARRDAFLEEGDNFYGYQYIKEKLTEVIKEIFKDTKEMLQTEHEACDALEAKGEPCNRPPTSKDFTTLTLIGELAGGFYEGAPIVKQGNGKVGGGNTLYSQDKSFYAFEIRVDNVPLDVYTLSTISLTYGVPVAPIVFFGTFDECIAYSTEHLNDLTLVPSMQPLLDEDNKPVLTEGGYTALPEIEGNYREGLVIAPCEPMWFPNGKRFSIKHKPARTSENTGSTKHNVQIKLCEEQELILEHILPLLNENRANNVESHLGALERKDFNKLAGLVVKDAYDEAYSNEEDVTLAYEALTTKQRKHLNKELLRECHARLRESFFLNH